MALQSRTLLTDLGAFALGVLAWAFFTGFAENSYGELTFSGHDLLRLALFGIATVLLSHALRRSAAHGSEQRCG